MPHLIGDPLRIKQIIHNLLSNAIKFTPEKGEIHFIVESENIDNIINHSLEKASENLEFKQMLSYLGSFEDSEKYFIVSDSSLEVNMTKNLSLGVSYRIDYVNKTEKENTDKKFLTSLIVDF